MALRERLLGKAESRVPIDLHRVLKRLDPASAARIHVNDTAKVIRAIEVTLPLPGPCPRPERKGSEALTGYRVLRLGLDPARPQLYQRINDRAQTMFAQGLMEETRDLLARYGRSPALDSKGYRQAAQYLDGALTDEQAVAAASQGHRNYAKRQLTWFRPNLKFVAEWFLRRSRLARGGGEPHRREPCQVNHALSPRRKDNAMCFPQIQ